MLRDLLEVIDDGLDFFGRVARAPPNLGFDHCQRWLELLGLQTAPGMADKLPHQQPFGLIVANVVIALMSSRAVGLAQRLPTIGRINCAAKLLGIDKGLDPQHPMAMGPLPVLA